MSRGDGESKPPGRGREARGGPAAPDLQAVPMGSLGAWLRAQREARGVSLKDIAEASKISLRHLEALERDRFDALPAPVFVRGFLREYGRIVGLDVDEVVNVYLLAAEAARPQQEARREAAAASVPSRGPATAARGALAAAAVALVLAAAGGIAWWLGRPQAVPAPERPRPESASSRASGPATSTGSAPATLPESAAPVDPAGGAAGGAEPPGPADGAGGPAPDPAPPASWPLTSPPPAAGEAPVAAAPEPLRVVLEFQQDCWVEVVVDGRRRESELKAGGETWAIEAADSVVLTLGNAPAVRVEVDGRPVQLPMEGTRVVREFRIDRGGVAAASPTPPAGT